MCELVLQQAGIEMMDFLFYWTGAVFWLCAAIFLALQGGLWFVYSLLRDGELTVDLMRVRQARRARKKSDQNTMKPGSSSCWPKA
jgi:hypothetical protein